MEQNQLLTPSQIQHIAGSFSRVFAVKAPLAKEMYKNLFAAHPELRGLFPDNLQAQQTKVTGALVFVLRQMTMPNALLTSIDELALSHRNLGIRPAFFDYFGTALLKALRDVTPGGLSPDEESAWSAAYTAIAGRMIEIGWVETV